MSLTETQVINMALSRIGAQRISSYADADEDNAQSVQARLHYEQTRDALLRSHWWRFARARVQLSANVTDPTFEWDYAYDLPANFLRLWIKPFEDNNVGLHNTRYSFSMEGKQLLSNEDEMYIRYIKRVTDCAQFDPLFVECLVLKLAIKFCMPMSQDSSLYATLYEEMADVMARVRTMDKQETNTIGRGERYLWNDARLTGASGDPAKSYG